MQCARQVLRAGMGARRHAFAAVSARPAARQLLPQRRFLKDTAERELAEEKSVRESMSVPACPAGWTVTHEAGQGYWRMTKSADGTDVLIDVEFEAHEGGGEDVQERTSFTAYVTRNGVTADFTIAYTPGDGLALEGVQTHPNKESAVDLTAEADYKREQRYQGPEVSDLAETGLPDKILDFLDSHGVNDSLGEFVHKQTEVLEQDAYVRLLGDLSKLAA
eukprot:TRINITY_DN22394_c0_g1_i1.p2 TRINITY_DN22394_c0_g1~~TRINITY_DN22394_c0_g1_i1.p2  ORF type:complete len:248 (+),score=111.88 TRINITY_DN22394_c0_g1_i1:85-744(+)